MNILENKEIDDLLDGYVPPTSGDEPSVEAPPTSDIPPEPALPPKEDDVPLVDGVVPPASAPPQEGAPASAEPSQPPADGGAPPPSEPPSAGDPRDEQIKQMKETIESLKQTIETVARTASQPVAPAPTNEPPATMKFLEKEEDLDKALNSVDNFNDLLSNVMTKVEAIILEKATAMASQMANSVYTQRSMVTDFYNANPDLNEHKAFVGVVANEIAAANPDWDMKKVVDALPAEVKNRLKLGINVEVPPPEVPPATPPAPPAFAGGKGSRRDGGPPTPPSAIEKEVADLLEGL